MHILNRIRELISGKVVAQVKDGTDTIRIIAHGRERVFMCNDIILSRLGPELFTGAYWDYFSPLPALYDNARVLVIGLGGGTIPYQLEALYGDRVHIDVVEISEAVAMLSKAFLPKPLRSRIIIADGSEFVKGLRPDSYDIIILDPYRTYALAGTFMDGPFIRAAHQALSERGVFAINYILDSRNSELLKEAMSLLKGRFSMYAIGAPEHSGNRVVVCSKKLTVEEILERIAARFHGGVSAKHIIYGYSAMRPLQ